MKRSEIIGLLIERDEEDIAAIDAAVDTFWHDYVEKDVMPVLVGTSGEA